MANINSYLRFKGNCREAMNFYQSILGGELFVMTVGESPMADKLPADMKDKIMHSSLTNGDLVIMASDMAMTEITNGNSLSMMLNCDSEEQIRTLYDLLAKNGKTGHPLENTFWGAVFGDLTDQYGFNWLLNFDKNTTK